jgi:hypothetical protein
VPSFEIVPPNVSGRGHLPDEYSTVNLSVQKNVPSIEISPPNDGVPSLVASYPTFSPPMDAFQLRLSTEAFKSSERQRFANIICSGQESPTIHPVSLSVPSCSVIDDISFPQRNLHLKYEGRSLVEGVPTSSNEHGVMDLASPTYEIKPPNAWLTVAAISKSRDVKLSFVKKGKKLQKARRPEMLCIGKTETQKSVISTMCVPPISLDVV